MHVPSSLLLSGRLKEDNTLPCKRRDKRKRFTDVRLKPLIAFISSSRKQMCCLQPSKDKKKMMIGGTC